MVKPDQKKNSMIMEKQFCEKCKKDREVINVIKRGKYDEYVLACGDTVSGKKITKILPTITFSKANSLASTPSNDMEDMFLEIDNTDYSPFERQSMKNILKAVNREIKHRPLPKIIDSLGVSLKISLPLATPYIIRMITKYLKSKQAPDSSGVYNTAEGN
jgi:hypothetical protein